MVVNIPIPADLPPGALAAWKQLVQTVQDLQLANAQQDAAIAQAKVSSTAPVQGTLNQPDLVNANVQIGDAPTLYVQPDAYFTRSGLTRGLVNVSWDYRDQDGQLLAGPSESFQVYKRVVREESDYPAYADMRIDPPPTGDASLALQTESMYGVIDELDILTTYAFKVRSISSLGVPGNWSDEVTVTTPKEPRLRPIDPPLLDDLGSGGAGVTWDWTQRWSSGTPGYPDVLGITGTKAALPLDTGRSVMSSWAASNGKVFVHADVDAGHEANAFYVVNPDGTYSTPDFHLLILTSSSGTTVDQVQFAPGPDGHLYGWSTYFNNASWAQPASITPPVGANQNWEVIWQINTSSNALSAVAVRAQTVDYSPWSSISPDLPQSTTSGIVRFPNGGMSGYVTLNTSTLAFNTTSWSSVSAFGATVVSLGANNFVGLARDSLTGNTYTLVRFNTAGTMSTQSLAGAILTPPPGNKAILFGDPVSGLFMRAGGSVYSIDNSGNTFLLSTATDTSGYHYGVVLVGYTIGAKGYDSGNQSGLWITNVITGYLYEVYTTSLDSGATHSGVFNSHNVAVSSGDLDLIWSNTSASQMPKSIPGAVTRAYVESARGITFIDGVTIAGDPGILPSALTPANPWPEIKYVIAQRLTGPDTWTDVGTYLGPGTLNDPVPPGTYQYRLVPVSATGERGTPTTAVTITIT